jgi:hypothetical protein
MLEILVRFVANQDSLSNKRLIAQFYIISEEGGPTNSMAWFRAEHERLSSRITELEAHVEKLSQRVEAPDEVWLTEALSQNVCRKLQRT